MNEIEEKKKTTGECRNVHDKMFTCFVKLCDDHHLQKISLKAEDKEESASQFLTGFFDALSQRPAPERSFSKELESFRTIFCEVLKLNQENVLSDKEAEILVRFFITKFAQGRFDRVVTQLLPSSNRRWFLTHHKVHR